MWSSQGGRPPVTGTIKRIIWRRFGSWPGRRDHRAVGAPRPGRVRAGADPDQTTGHRMGRASAGADRRAGGVHRPVTDGRGSNRCAHPGRWLRRRMRMPVRPRQINGWGRRSDPARRCRLGRHRLFATSGPGRRKDRRVEPDARIGDKPGNDSKRHSSQIRPKRRRAHTRRARCRRTDLLLVLPFRYRHRGGRRDPGRDRPRRRGKSSPRYSELRHDPKTESTSRRSSVPGLLPAAHPRAHRGDHRCRPGQSDPPAQPAFCASVPSADRSRSLADRVTDTEIGGVRKSNSGPGAVNSLPLWGRAAPRTPSPFGGGSGRGFS